MNNFKEMAEYVLERTIGKIIPRLVESGMIDTEKVRKHLEMIESEVKNEKS